MGRGSRSFRGLRERRDLRPQGAWGEDPDGGWMASGHHACTDERKELLMSAAIQEDSPKTGNVAADRLRGLVERIERLEEERKSLSGDIRDIFTEAKSAGFDVKALRQLIRIRKQEPAAVEEQETLLDLYRRALGM